MIEAILTLVGAIIGFAANEISQALRTRRDEQKQITSVRRIIKIEIDLNLKLLRELHEKMLGEMKTMQEDRSYCTYSRRFLALPFPSFLDRGFHSQLPLFALAYTEEEILRLFQFYDRLSRLKTLRECMNLALSDQEAEWDLASGGSNAVPIGRTFGLARKFDTYAPAYWVELDSLMKQLLSDGNPIIDEPRSLFKRKKGKATNHPAIQ